MSNSVRHRLAAEIPHLRRFARSLEPDRSRADDLVQACLERALRKRHLWRPTGALRSWLFRILYREFLSSKRTGHLTWETVDIEDAAPHLGVSARQTDQLHCQDVMSAVNGLPDEQRAALSLVAMDEVSYEQAAKILDVPEGTLRSRIARARATVRQRMSQTPASGEPVHLRRVK